MYNLINQHVNLILDNIPQEFVGQYNWLVERLQQGNVAEDPEYRQSYRNYWTMNRARLTQDFYDEYFRLLEININNAKINIQHIAEALHNVAHTFQFSFATKLVHMVNRQMPIYDSNIRQFYFLPEVNPNNYLQSWNFLCDEYGRIIHNGLLEQSINEFRDRFHPVLFEDQRIIDSLIWTFVRIAKRGGFRDGIFFHR